MSPRENTVQEIFVLLDSVQAQLQQIRLRAKDLIDHDNETPDNEEGSSNGK